MASDTQIASDASGRREPDVVRFEAAPGNVIDSYLHMQGGRGVNAVLVEMANATQSLAHDANSRVTPR